jgi:uncharacterized RDD family membrane protein YckC
MSLAEVPDISRPVEGFRPPEGVAIGFNLATLGRRGVALMLDMVIAYAVVAVVLIGLERAGLLSLPAFATLVLLLNFLARSPYLILSELVWNGRTLGKRITGIRVISADGRRLTPHQIAVRNLMKEVEFFLPVGMAFGLSSAHLLSSGLSLLWIVGVAVVPIRSRRNQRIGDMIAGTLVVEMPKPLLLDDLALREAPQAARFTFTRAQLDVYGRRELQVLEHILRRPAVSKEQRLEREQVAVTIRRKIGCEEIVQPADTEEFLVAFYRAQREYLESRQLFGDRREDKFHGQRGGEPK